MLGISALFSVSRLLLVISYCRGKFKNQSACSLSDFSPVRFYARKSTEMHGQNRPLHIQIATYLISSSLYASAALIVKLNLYASSVALRLTLWALATLIEVVSFLWTPDIPGSLLINDNYVGVMGGRVRTLTTIILGEGQGASTA